MILKEAPKLLSAWHPWFSVTKFNLTYFFCLLIFPCINSSLSWFGCFFCLVLCPIRLSFQGLVLVLDDLPLIFNILRTCKNISIVWYTSCTVPDTGQSAIVKRENSYFKVILSSGGNSKCTTYKNNYTISWLIKSQRKMKQRRGKRIKVEWRVSCCFSGCHGHSDILLIRWHLSKCCPEGTEGVNVENLGRRAF